MSSYAQAVGDRHPRPQFAEQRPPHALRLARNGCSDANTSIGASSRLPFCRSSARGQFKSPILFTPTGALQFSPVPALRKIRINPSSCVGLLRKMAWFPMSLVDDFTLCLTIWSHLHRWVTTRPHRRSWPRFCRCSRGMPAEGCRTSPMPTTCVSSSPATHSTIGCITSYSPARASSTSRSC